MYTREQYLNKEVTHRQYYAQFVDKSAINTVIKYIGRNRIKDSIDESFNDIPLDEWDSLPGRGSSLCEQVCIYKEAAKQIREGLI